MALIKRCGGCAMALGLAWLGVVVWGGLSVDAGIGW